MGLGIGDVYGTNRGRLTLQLRQVHSSIDVAMKYTVLPSFRHIFEA